MIKFITVVDENIINQIALKLLVSNLLEFNLNKNLVVLCTQNSINSEYKDWLATNEVLYREFQSENIKDPYRAKFLIKKFLDSDSTYHDYLCYVDPDHVVFEKPSFPQIPESTLFISSEAQPAHERAGEFYNTSIIYGRFSTMKTVAQGWHEEYYSIMPFTSFRHREELAFVLSAKKMRVISSPLPASVQGNLSVAELACQFFHYGGEYLISKEIKRCFQSQSPVNCLENLIDKAKDDVSSKLIHKINILARQIQWEH